MYSHRTLLTFTIDTPSAAICDVCNTAPMYVCAYHTCCTRKRKTQPRLLGSLLTAMVEFSKVAAGMQVAYVELTGVAVTLVGNEATNTFCALFHDREDGATFGRLIASEVCTACWVVCLLDVYTCMCMHNYCVSFL